MEDDVEEDFFEGRPKPEELAVAIEEAHWIIDKARELHGPIQRSFLMLSGGNDSMVVLDVCSALADDIAHINTGIGIPETNEFVRRVVADRGRPLIELHPPIAYDDLVLGYDDTHKLFGGFPGPGVHHFIYARLKERCVEKLLRDHRSKNGQRFLLLTGIRNDESKRRMGYSHPIDRKGGQVWVNPLIRWSNELMKEYREVRQLPVNEVTVHLHMSGECLCGAFARPGELDEIGFFYPEFTKRIRALEAKAAAKGLPACKWGERPPKKAKTTWTIERCLVCGSEEEEEHIWLDHAWQPVSEEVPIPYSILHNEWCALCSASSVLDSDLTAPTDHRDHGGPIDHDWTPVTVDPMCSDCVLRAGV